MFVLCATKVFSSVLLFSFDLRCDTVFDLLLHSVDVSCCESVFESLSRPLFVIACGVSLPLAVMASLAV